MSDNKFYLKGKISLQEETASLKEKASKIIDLPTEVEKQPDLMYFSAVLVSSGENLNHAFFAGSELVAAHDTIVNKALDIEHIETDIIGHIYERAYMDKAGNKLELSELASKEVASLDNTDMHIAIAGIIYKNRFPNFAKEVADGKWDSVSMECYYRDFDVKVGNMILSRKEAEVLGLASVDKDILGRVAKIMRGGQEIAKGTIARVLRGICFSGCGVVKNPANPASVIIETATEKCHSNSAEIIILDYDKLNNNLTSSNVEDPVNKQEDARDGRLDDSTGICVSFKRRVTDKSDTIIATNWCALYEKSCTSFSRDTTDPECLRNVEIRNLAKAALEKHIKESDAKGKRNKLIAGLKSALREAEKS